MSNDRDSVAHGAGWALERDKDDNLVLGVWGHAFVAKPNHVTVKLPKDFSERFVALAPPEEEFDHGEDHLKPSPTDMLKVEFAVMMNGRDLDQIEDSEIDEFMIASGEATEFDECAQCGWVDYGLPRGSWCWCRGCNGKAKNCAVSHVTASERQTFVAKMIGHKPSTQDRIDNEH